MTVTYSNETAKAGIGLFLRLLARWRGSIYKIIWMEVLFYLLFYYILNIIYLYCLDEYGKKHFINIVTYFSTYGNSIPLSFILGFYVNIVYSRWWSQYCTIPYPDNIGILVGASVSGHEDKSRMIRRTIMRYVCAAFTITLSMIAPKVKRRFPTFNHFVKAGLLNAQEKKIIEELDNEYPSYKKYWLVGMSKIPPQNDHKQKIKVDAFVFDNENPIVKFNATVYLYSIEDIKTITKNYSTVRDLIIRLFLFFPFCQKKLKGTIKLPLAWAANVAERARSEGIIKDEMGLKDILEEINKFREKCKHLCDYDWICIPLCYTQVVTLAVYLYFLFAVIGSQFVEEQADGEITLFKFPLMSCVEFFFYMGWLNVAERLINPFGEDDDDFEVNWMIDRHLQVGYLLVDKIHDEHPRLTKDPHWNKMAPNQLPFTVATQKFIFEHPVESTCDINVNRRDQDLVFKDDVGSLEGTLLNAGISLRKVFARRNTNNVECPLKRVTLKTDIQEEDWDEFNSYEGEETAENVESHVANTEDFDSLRKERLDKRKEALLKCLEIVKDDKEEARKILDEIFK